MIDVHLLNLPTDGTNKYNFNSDKNTSKHGKEIDRNRKTFPE